DTGEFTGRSPKDKYIVLDELTRDTVCRNDINQSFDTNAFDLLHDRMIHYLADKEIYVRDVAACHDDHYQITIRSICEYPRSDLFVHNMFISTNSKEESTPTRTIVCAP
ncbi:phosphoenolpyruvate carboxykinase (ATP), partial [Patescibacteria group bacterium]|nr:phosphoenolpyruvate carboxykinase (ATP) [Patescibacteria group bacterium]